MNKNKTGTTLVEVMLAALILGVIALSAASMLALSRSTILIQSHKLSTLTQAIGIMERIRVEPYANIRPTAENTTFYLNQNLQLTNTSPFWNTDAGAVSVKVQRFNLSSPTLQEWIQVTLTVGAESEDHTTLSTVITTAL